MNKYTICCPPVEELASVTTNVKCTESDCSASFKTTSNLNMHLVRHHKINKDLLKKSECDTRYHCPIENCDYYLGRLKFFQKFKYLKQHFLKVHADKTFTCSNCKGKFSTLSRLNLHEKCCGATYVCNCGWTYSSREAIQTHCRRKGHTMSNKISPVKDQVLPDSLDKPDTVKTDKTVLIYPKLSVTYIAAIALVELSSKLTDSKTVDKEIQTEQSHSDMKNQRKTEKKRKSSQQTQTGYLSKSKKVKISAETQTSNDLRPFKRRGSSARKKKTSMETQTNKRIKINKNFLKDISFDVEKTTIENKLQNVVFDDSSSNPINSDAALHDSLSLPTELKKEISKTDNFTQICDLDTGLFEIKEELFVDDDNKDNVFDINKFSTIETQTELDTLLMDCDDASLTLCSTTETQTTEDFDPLLYSNTCTQTCDEIDSLFDFNFVDIETQTAWADLDEGEYLSS